MVSAILRPFIQSLQPEDPGSHWIYRRPAEDSNSPEAMSSDESLEYVTLDSVPWSQGHQRPRMDPEERKVKHRLVQRRHMERKRERVAQLKATTEVLELQLKWLKANQETKRLTQELHELRQRFEARRQPWVLPVEPKPDTVEELAITEILAVVDQLESQSSDAHLNPMPQSRTDLKYNNP